MSFFYFAVIPERECQSKDQLKKDVKALLADFNTEKPPGTDEEPNATDDSQPPVLKT